MAMTEYLTQEASLAAVADAIRAQTGSTKALTFPTDFVAGVENIKKRTAWYRPPDWPDITSLPLDDVNVELYFTLDKGLPGTTDTVSLNVIGYNTIVEIGTMSNGAFVAANTYENSGVFNVTHTLNLSSVEGRFVIVHVLTDGGFDDPSGYFARQGNWFASNAPIIEMYGNFVSGRIFNTNYNMKAATLGHEAIDWTSDGLSLRELPTALEMLDLSNYGGLRISSRFFYSIFSNQRSLKTIKFPDLTQNSLLLDTDSQSNWPTQAFQNCYALFELDLSFLDMSECTDISQICDCCYSLQTLDISGWDLSALTKINNAFRGCTSLENLITDGCIMPSISFSLSDCTALTVDSLVGVIAALPELAEDTTATLTLGDTNTAKLTEEQIAVATEKGWTIA